jgi:hypothetical protein
LDGKHSRLVMSFGSIVEPADTREMPTAVGLCRERTSSVTAVAHPIANKAGDAIRRAITTLALEANTAATIRTRAPKDRW